MQTCLYDFLRYVAIMLASGVVTLALATAFIDSVWWGRLMHDVYMLISTAAFCRYVMWRKRFL